MLTDASADATPAQKLPTKRWTSTSRNGRTFTWLWAPDVSRMMSFGSWSVLLTWRKGNVVLEVGAHLGLSTIALASTAEHLVSVDWHRGDTQTTGWGFTSVKYVLNLIRYDVLDNVHAVMCADGYNFADSFSLMSFDLIVPRRDHRYEKVLQNIDLYLPKAETRGVDLLPRLRDHRPAVRGEARRWMRVRRAG
jgi:hypothetical protein